MRTPLLALTLTAALVTPPVDAAAPGPAPSAYGLKKNVQLVGYTSLGNRGTNSPIGVAGRCVYVGDRYDRNGVAIVDVANPARPRQIGTIPPVRGATQRELRADEGLGLLVVMSYSLTTGSTTGNNLKIYDIRNCAKPALLSTYDFGARSPHEFFLWKDPKKPGRALAYVATTIFSPDLEVVDLTDPAAPKLLTVYDTAADGARPFGAFDSSGGYLHSISVSDDGTRAYLGTWDWGVYVADTSLLANGTAPVIRPIGAPAFYDGNVHGAVKVPGKPYAVLVEEGYAGIAPPTADAGCPFGWLRMVDLSNEALPKLTGGEFKLRENDCERSKQLNGTFTSHDQTVFPNVALVPWYGGGLRVVDISDPTALAEAGAFVPKPAFEPDRRDPNLAFDGQPDGKWTGMMWSYPVVRNGLIYVVDIDLGLFVLRYTGKHAGEVSQAGFVEGNSAPSRYRRSDPVIRRATPLPTVTSPRTVRSPYADAPVSATTLARYRAGYGFFCVGLPS